MAASPRRSSRPVTDDDRQRVAELHAQGLGRNEIARRMERGPRTISVIAEDLGLTFDRSATAVATEARKADLAERRVVLAELLQGDAERLREQLWEPATVFNFGGKDNTFEKRELPEPPAEAKKALLASAGMAIDRSLKLVPPETETGEDEARSMLGKVMTGLTTLWNEQQQADGEGDGDAQ